MCQKMQFFNFLKYGESVMCTLHLLCVFISMVDKFQKFSCGLDNFSGQKSKIYSLWESSLKVIPTKKWNSIHGSFLHALINSLQASPAFLKGDTITVDC